MQTNPCLTWGSPTLVKYQTFSYFSYAGFPDQPSDNLTDPSPMQQYTQTFMCYINKDPPD